MKIQGTIYGHVGQGGTNSSAIVAMLRCTKDGGGSKMEEDKKIEEIRF